jgi:wyosine [tRNA(Phe)-imidazoG37] synthetase (radical SAM superfamily)
MSNNFCRFLSNGHSFVKYKRGTDVVVEKPCCWFAGDSPNPVSARFFEKPGADLSDDNDFNSIQGWTDACEKCRVLEQSGMQSLRKSSFDLISENGHAVDINLDIKCNGACVICGPSLSTLWQSEYKKIDIPSYVKNLSDENIDKTLDNIFDSLDFGKVEYIKFWGGEPLFTDTHLKVIKRIQNPEKVTLHYTTNASIFPSTETLREWEKFKMILFYGSIDGIEDQFDYIRWPMKWKKVTRNLLKLSDVAPVNLLFRVEFTANFMNSFYYDSLENWIKENLKTNRLGDRTEINIHPCIGPWSINKMPMAIREMVLDKFNHEHPIHKLVSKLPESENLDNWYQFVNRWDQIRGNSWKDTFPDLVDKIP